jgi:hypothetical protein
VSEVDPDPADAGRSMLGDRIEPSEGDPTGGGKRGQIGQTPSIAADEPDDGSTYPPAGGAGS